jgi:hypothetical protein
MKKAYIILAHKNPEQLHRLIKRLDDNSSTFFLHIDKKVPLTAFNSLTDFGDKVQYVERVYSEWASFQLVEATLNGMKAIKAANQDYDVISLLSGQDYPIKSNTFIDHFFQTSPYKIFIEYFTIPNYERWQVRGGLFRIDKYFFGLKFYQRYSAKALNFLARFIPRLRRKPPPELIPYGGSQWWTINMYALHYILDFIEKNPAYMSFHKATFASDEIFFQTILLNSKDKRLLNSISNDNKRYMHFRCKELHPSILTKANIEEIKNSDALFARKLDCEEDCEIFDLIDEACLKQTFSAHKS